MLKNPVRIYQVKVEGVEAPVPDATPNPLEPKERNIPNHNLFLLISFGVIFILVSGYFIYRYTQKSIQESTAKVKEVVDKSIAVIPFANLSNDQEQEYFAEGIADDILDQLVKTTDLKVKSRTATLKFKNTIDYQQSILKKPTFGCVCDNSILQDQYHGLIFLPVLAGPSCSMAEGIFVF